MFKASEHTILMNCRINLPLYTPPVDPQVFERVTRRGSDNRGVGLYEVSSWFSTVIRQGAV